MKPIVEQSRGKVVAIALDRRDEDAAKSLAEIVAAAEGLDTLPGLLAAECWAFARAAVTAMGLTGQIGSEASLAANARLLRVVRRLRAQSRDADALPRGVAGTRTRRRRSPHGVRVG